jgi:hypothetical protein
MFHALKYYVTMNKTLFIIGTKIFIRMSPHKMTFIQATQNCVI